jgi:type I restriction enzyme M protein
MARIMDPEPGMSVHNPCCGSAGLLIACVQVLDEKVGTRRVSEGGSRSSSLSE